MSMIRIGCFALILIVIVYQVFCIINLVIPGKKRKLHLLITIIASIILLTMTYIYADKWYKYLFGILTSIIIILNLYKSGIISKGFSFPSGYTGALVSDMNWDKIERVKINQGKCITLKFTGNTSFVPDHEYQLYFAKNEYKKIITILKEHLPSQKKF